MGKVSADSIRPLISLCSSSCRRSSAWPGSVALMIFLDRARALSEFYRVLRHGRRLVICVNTKPERSLTGLVRAAVARHVPTMTAAMAHHYSLSGAARLRMLLEAAQFRDIDVMLETRSFFFPLSMHISSRSNKVGDRGERNTSLSRKRCAKSSGKMSGED
jgi:hypothetical protein